MPTFFVASHAVTPTAIRITGPLLRHLRDSLRLHAGDSLVITDDRPRRYLTEVTNVTSQALESRIVETVAAPARTSPSLVLAQALLKGEKMDWGIQKATELGVDCIVPVNTKHGIVKVQPDRLEHQQTRWQRIALEAAQQSERWTIPTIAKPTDFPRLLVSYASATAKYLLLERSRGVSFAAVSLPTGTDQTVILLIGSEGGWDREEQRQAQERGFAALTLGSRILRAETAAIAALSIIQSRIGELG